MQLLRQRSGVRNDIINSGVNLGALNKILRRAPVDEMRMNRRRQ
jgi:hypothetical protein